jgi:hypothetical protein
MNILKLVRQTALSFALITGVTAAAGAQSFEGIIEFKQYTAKDTTLNAYYVKGNKIKLDQLGKSSHKPEGSFLFDIGTNKITGLNHSRKIYDNVNVSKSAPTNKIDTVIKLKEIKMLHGIKCHGYTVKSKADNVQITYWLAGSNFNFFEPSVLLWNRKDKASVYYRAIKDSKGMMPLLSVESDLSGKEISKLEVTKIDKKVLEASQLEIPKEYKKME